jgi:flagellar basal-body rod protein FlgC
MSVKAVSSGMINIAARGLHAQRTRMDVIAGNIANADTTRDASGDPYRSRTVVLRAGKGLSGPTVVGIGEAPGELYKKIYDPDDPRSDDDGFVRMSNVEIPKEIIQLVTASRAYQANAAVMKRYQDSVDVTLELLR